jgi:hypothetical protein
MNTPIFDGLAEEMGFMYPAYLTRVTWDGVVCWGLGSTPTRHDSHGFKALTWKGQRLEYLQVLDEDRDPPWSKRKDA